MNIYMDNAATTEISKTVMDKMIHCMKHCYGNPSSLHSYGIKAKDALHEARASIAKCLKCEENELVFLSGGSEANNQAILSAAREGERRGKKHIITSKIEHKSVLSLLNILEANYGFHVTYVDVESNGVILCKKIEQALRKDTCLVSVMFANNELGTIQPIEEIAEICKKNEILFHVDAVQAIGRIPINMKNINYLTASAHKFHGPKGIGILYVKKEAPISSLIIGGNQEFGLRAGTENVGAIVGMATALVDTYENMEQNSGYIWDMQKCIIERLIKIPGSVINGDLKKRLPGIINICFEGVDGTVLVGLLNKYNIFASTGSACAEADLQPSHVLKAIGCPQRLIYGSLRLSLSKNNTYEQVEYVTDTINMLVNRIREHSPLLH